MRREEIEPLTLDQTKALVEAARGDRPEALYVAAVTTGLRQGELLGLKWEDVDPDRGILQVRSTLVASKGGRPAFGAPKTDKGKRSVRTPGAPVEALERHHVLQLEEREKLAERWQDHGLVFCTGVLCSSSYRLGQYCSGPESVGQHHSYRHSATSGYPRRVAISCTAWQSTMLASPDSWTVSSPSKTAVGTSTGLSNLFGMLFPSSSASLKDTSAPKLAAEGGCSQPGSPDVAPGWELGGCCEYPFVGAAVQRELLPALASEDGTPGSPVVFGTYDHRDLPAFTL